MSIGFLLLFNFSEVAVREAIEQIKCRASFENTAQRYVKVLIAYTKKRKMFGFASQILW